MTEQHPITPPPELMREWFSYFFGYEIKGDLTEAEYYMATKAARWGADQELQACCEWIDTPAEFETVAWNGKESDQLRAARRPKPSSLKAQAIQALDEEQADMSIVNYQVIRSVLEALDD